MLKHKTYIVEKRETYKGYDYAITFTDMGHRCAYIILRKPIVFKNLDPTDENGDLYNYWYNIHKYLDIYGGMTYCNWHNLDLEDPEISEFVIGWDYIHSWNKPNYGQAFEYFPEKRDIIAKLMEMNKPIYDDKDKHFASLEDVEKDCKNLINQIIDKNFDFYDSSLFINQENIPKLEG